jgi:hypothetical protein
MLSIVQSRSNEEDRFKVCVLFLLSHELPCTAVDSYQLHTLAASCGHAGRPLNMPPTVLAAS